MRQSLRVRLWSLWNVPLLFLVGPAVLEVNERRCEVRIPLNWKTMRRDIRAMYFGVLCMGADVAGGLIAFDLIQRRKESVSFIFKDFKTQFLKRAEGDVHFINEDGAIVQQLLARAIETGERQEATVHVTATVPKKLGAEPVALFELTLSLKKRG
jgi:acyl-coenzyme A thioesterase PaaI-like protein